MPWQTVLRDASGGYGDQERQAPNRYHYSVGIDARVAKHLRLCPPSTRNQPAGHSDVAVGAVAWKDDVGWAFFAPVGGKLIRYGNEVSVEDLPGTQDAQGVALHEDGSGNATLYVSFGGDDFICRRAMNGTFAQATATEDVKAYQMEPLDDGRLVRVDTTQYKISILPAGSNPFTAASWGSSITVGSPHYKVTALAHIGDIIVVCKEDGVYTYNPVNTTFINLIPSIAPHEDNGKGAANIGGLGVLVPLANGDVVLIDQGLMAYSVGPGREAQPGRDTPMGRITALGYDGEWGYAYLEPFVGKSRGAGVTTTGGLGTAVMVDNGGSFTDYSPAAIDNNPDTVVEVTALGGAASTDYLYVGAEYPFEGCHVTLGVVNSTATSGISGVEYYDGSNWTACTLLDLTYRSIPDCSFARSGYLGWSLGPFGKFFNVAGTMGKVAVNGKTKYWVRFRFDTDAAVDA